MTRRRLIIWRHGQTEWNANGRVQGQLDIPLDSVGERQAEDAAPGLAELEPSVIVASDLRRASQTAMALARLTGLPLDVDARLRERAFGPWQGLHRDEIAQRYPEEFARWNQGLPLGEPGVESLEAMFARVGAAVREAAQRVPGGTAVVVMHGGAAKAACGALLGWPTQIMESLGGLNNCCFSELKWSAERGWRLVRHNAWPGAPALVGSSAGVSAAQAQPDVPG